uniref:Eukaryotic translation initiation factor 4B3 n=1 Tax=Triticum urartu TaxID=4572 RepID=A0A8R7QT58_TRIUA
MAVASAWAKPGSWALAAEEQDDLPPPPPPVPASDFPDLATAATTKVPKKKKVQPVSLASFNSAKFVPSSSRGPTPDMLLSLPTGPRERTEEELGGARWGNVSRGSDEPRRGGSGTEDYGPSRADEADDWGVKKPMERRERMGGFGGDSISSRADDVNDWVSTKKTAPSLPMERRERSSAFGSESQGRADDSTSWVSNKSYSAPPLAPSDGRRGGSVWGFNRDGCPDADSWARKREEDEGVEEDKGEFQPKSWSCNPFGAARPREEVLAAKVENLTKEVYEREEKLVIQPKVRSWNPFGAARPREEVLAGKGEDWRKIDEKLEALKVREAPPEVRSSGRRGSPVQGEENENGEVLERSTDRVWKKPTAVEAEVLSEQGSEVTGAAPAN